MSEDGKGLREDLGQLAETRVVLNKILDLVEHEKIGAKHLVWACVMILDSADRTGILDTAPNKVRVPIQRMIRAFNGEPDFTVIRAVEACENCAKNAGESASVDPSIN